MKIKPFQKNDRVVFFGDSITHNNQYINYIYSYYNKHFKDRNVRFYNAGIAGSNAGYGLSVYESDVKIWNPTVVVVMFGMNDSRRDILTCQDKKIREMTLNTAFETYKVNLDKMYRKLINEGVRVILCTPTPYDEVNSSNEPAIKGAQALIEKYADYVREFANNNGVELVDYNKSLTKALKLKKNLIKEDHVHPTPEVGHVEMAKCFLKAQGYRLDIDSLSPEFVELDRLVQLHRDVVASEFLFLPQQFSKEEKLDYARKFKEEGERDIYYDYFVFLADRYAEHNGDPEPIRIQIEKQIDLINSRD